MANNSQDSYCIWIRNRSGLNASYALISSPPLIEPPLDSVDFSTTIICSFRNVPKETGIVRFEIPKQIYAVCGTVLYDKPDSSSVFEIMDQRPITIARDLGGDNAELGTSLHMIVADGQPAFDDEVQEFKEAKEGSFSITTKADFTFPEAKNSM